MACECSVLEKAKLLYEFDIEEGRPEYIVNVSRTVSKGSFHRVGYYLQLQHPVRGNQWVYTCFDAFSKDPLCVGIPTVDSGIFCCNVSNMSIQASDGTYVRNASDGRIQFSAYNYLHGDNSTMAGTVPQGDYGCMQVYRGDDVVWAYNCHNGHVSDLGIGNGTSGPHKDWTFAANSDEYTYKKLKVFVVYNDVVFDTETHTSNTDECIAHKDVLAYNVLSKNWETPKVSFVDHANEFLPNVVIAFTGQGCAVGINTTYEVNCPFDWPHERIFGYVEETDNWETANLNTESLGTFCDREAGWQCAAFHIARRMVETDPCVRPGIISLAAAGRQMCHWARFDRTSTWYSHNRKCALLSEAKQQGEMFQRHCKMISKAMKHLSEHGKHTIDLLVWLGGDCDRDQDESCKGYFEDAIAQIDQQYRRMGFVGPGTPMLFCETSGTGLVKQHSHLRHIDVSHCVTRGNMCYIDTRNQRRIGTLCFQHFRDMASKGS